MVAPMARCGAFAEESEAPLIGEVKRGRPPKDRAPKPIAPYERDPAIAASRAFDRKTGEPVSVGELKTYADALALYHLSEENKFENGRAFDLGRTERRHIRVAGTRLIGKEANTVGDAGEEDPTTEAVVEFCGLTQRGSRPEHVGTALQSAT